MHSRSIILNSILIFVENGVLRSRRGRGGRGVLRSIIFNSVVVVRRSIIFNSVGVVLFLEKP